MMIVTTVSVRRLKTTGGYNNVAVELTATIGPDDDYRKCRADLDLMVQAEIEGKDVSAIVAERDNLKWQVESLRREKGRLEIRCEELRREISRQPASTREPLKLVEPTDG